MKIYTLPDGTDVTAQQQFTIKDQRYSAGWLLTASEKEIEAAGIAVREEPDPVLPEEPKPIPVVTMRQARLALLGAGLLDAINEAVKSAGEAAVIEWEYAQEVRRDSPLIAQLAEGIKLSDEQIDELFDKAQQIQ